MAGQAYGMKMSLREKARRSARQQAQRNSSNKIREEKRGVAAPVGIRHPRTGLEPPRRLCRCFLTVSCTDTERDVWCVRACVCM